MRRGRPRSDLAWSYTLDFAKPAGTRVEVFAKLFISGDASCTYEPNFFVEDGVTDVAFKGERFVGSFRAPDPVGLTGAISGADDPGARFGVFMVRHDVCIEP